MNVLQILGVILSCVALFALVCFFPGYLICRGRFGGDVDAEVSASLALSLFLVYLLSFCVWIYRLPLECLYGYSLLSLTGAILWRKTWYGLLRQSAFRERLPAFAAISGWCLLWLASIINVSAAAWSGDWYEHYERALFFLEQKPFDTKFLGVYLLSARPPLFNVVSAFFMAHIGAEYWHYQIIQLLLNMTVVWGCYSLIRACGFKHRCLPWLIVLFLGMNPAFVHNMTYGWSRHLSTFFALSAIAFYLRFRRSRSQRDVICAYGLMGFGILTHYSVAPYLVSLVIVDVLWKDGRALWRGRLAAFGLLSFIVGHWLLWCVQVFGLRGAFLQNSTAMGMAQVGFLEKLRQGLYNLKICFIPPLGGDNPAWDAIRQKSSLGLIKDVIFTIYQSNLMFMLGSLMPLMLLWRVVQKRHAWKRDESARLLARMALWAGGIALFVVYERTTFGVAHSCHQPIVFGALCLAAAGYRNWGKPLRGTAFLGWCLDLFLGIVLLYAFQHRHTAENLSLAAKRHMETKVRHQLIFLGDKIGL